MQLIETTTPARKAVAPASTVGPGHLGMFSNAETESPLIFGCNVAGQGLQRSLFEYGAFQHYDLYAHPGQEARAGEQIARHLRRGRKTTKRIQVHSVRDLLKGSGLPAFTAWHDTSADFTPSLHLRSIAARQLYPVTSTHYTISYSNMLHDFYLRLLLAETYPCDSIICNTSAARQVFANILDHVADNFNRAFGTHLRYQGRLDVVPHGINTDLFKPRDKADVRYQLHLPADAFIVLYVGRFSATDKMDLLPLLPVYQRLAQAHPERNLLFVFAGTDRNGYASALLEYARALDLELRIRIIQDLPNGSQHLLHAAADIFVSPSDNIQECFGLAPVEAMASGVPQVVADWDGYRNTVAHGETGFRVPTRWARCDGDLRAPAALMHWEQDHLALAQSVVVDMAAYEHYLNLLICNDDLRLEMSRKSRLRALSVFSEPTVVAAHEALWHELSEIAREHALRPQGRTDYCQPPYYDAFAHYCTEPIAPDARLRITPAGTRVLRGKEPLPGFPGMFDCVNETVLRKGLAILRVFGSFGSGYALQTLASDLARSESLHPDHALRHLLWLLKHGFASLRETDVSA